METNQIFNLVNSVCKQAFGSDIEVTDTAGLISLGDTVLSSNDNVDNFTSTLVQRIGKTIYHYRAYRNKLSNIVLSSDMEWGAILQKISMVMPEAEEDDSFDIGDATTVDPWTIAKPVIKQKLFVGRNPFQFKITIQKHTLREAFNSESAMASFIGFVFGVVRNKIEASLENVARVVLAGSAVETGATQQIKLLTMYNAESGKTLTADAALFDKDFMAWCAGTINLYSDYLTDLSKLYNDGTIETHTPKEDQKLTVLSSFERKLETTVQYQAFHDGYVKLNNYETLNFWQSPKTPGQIKSKKLTGGKAETTLDNVVAIMHDRDALGVYQMDEDVLTTPVNAAGRYYNTFYHIMRNYFLDKSENMLVFLLA